MLGREFHFARGERIHTENSHKYAVEEFQALRGQLGWTPVKAWTEPAELFSLHLLQLVTDLGGPDAGCAGGATAPISTQMRAVSRLTCTYGLVIGKLKSGCVI